MAVGLLLAVGTVVPAGVPADPQQYLPDVIGQMVSPYLLGALGFLLALRCGAVDLSVWASFALGGAVAAGLINASLPASFALALGAAAGAVFGTVNAVMVALVRLPSAVATLTTALVIVIVLQVSISAKTISIPDDTFDGWHITARPRADGGGESSGEDTPEGVGVSLPLSSTRMLLVAGVYSLTMIVLMVTGAPMRRVGAGKKMSLFLSLCACGALAGAGGALWLIDRSATPLPTVPIGDLRIPAAALLAGGAFICGHSGTLLAGAILPAAMLAATIWRQEVLNVQVHGYSLQTLVLVGMTITAQWALARALAQPGRGRVAAGIAGAFAVAGMIVLAQSAGDMAHGMRQVLHLVAGGCWAVAAAVVMATKVSSRLSGSLRTGRYSA